MTVFFTADQHFGHANIIKYANRPFDSIDQMDKVLVEEWNLIVGEDDFVVHLGDFTLGGVALAAKHFRRLNGSIEVVTTDFHHDRRWAAGARGKALYESKSSYIVEVLTGVELMKDPLIALSHTPMARWYRAHYGAWHLFGHCHGRYHPEGLAMDVGVDAAARILGAYRPFSIEDVTRIMKKKGE